MDKIKPLTLEDYDAEQVLEALKHCPEQIQVAVVSVCAQIEVRKSRAAQEG